ncbi:hypothetical protein MIR68_004192 [Amoeboaphelidium protococcarum]|nr:hypothetical protein MIR68_004192 [Amoeboaphelidium protococcarum]
MMKAVFVFALVFASVAYCLPKSESPCTPPYTSPNRDCPPAPLNQGQNLPRTERNVRPRNNEGVYRSLNGALQNSNTGRGLFPWSNLRQPYELRERPQQQQYRVSGVGLYPGLRITVPETQIYDDVPAIRRASEVQPGPFSDESSDGEDFDDGTTLEEAFQRYLTREQQEE